MGPDFAFGPNVCRLCDRNASVMHSVFERNAEGQQIMQLIKDCLPILIYRTDPLPKHICESCYLNLSTMFAFRKTSLETFDKQKQRLRTNSTGSSINVRLYLNTLDNENGVYEKKQPRPRRFQSSTPTVNGESASNEAEMCAQLQKDLEESLQRTKRQEQGDYFNGEQEFDVQDSLDSPEIDNYPDSDMELCDSDGECPLQISTVDQKFTFTKDQKKKVAANRRRFVGPKSHVRKLREEYLNKLRGRNVVDRQTVAYNPLSLMQLVLNYVNKENVPDFPTGNSVKVTTFESDTYNPVKITGRTLSCEEEPDSVFDTSVCDYCESMFANVKHLAVHEQLHMNVMLGDKVDCNWPENQRGKRHITKLVIDAGKSKRENGFENGLSPQISNSDAAEMMQEDVENLRGGDQNLLVPMKESSGNEEGDLIGDMGEVVLIDTKPMVNGVPLIEVPKEERRTMYKSLVVNGIKKKFCPLCRYTFKDNWAIESHYLSTACHYTCRFCGLRYNKQRTEFDDHVKEHILAGEQHTTHIFESKKNQTAPKIISTSRLRRSNPELRRQPSPKPKLQVIKPAQNQVNHFLPRNETQSPPVTIKTEPGLENSAEIKPQSQAYFCRKCYQVFFKLDEFNTHVVDCKGTGVNESVPNNMRPAAKSRTSTSSPMPSNSSGGKEEVSPSGRPMRNCVKEIATYMDIDEREYEYEPVRRPPLSMQPTARGYECNLCSSCFPTIHSRNSHMRIHKPEVHMRELSSKSITIQRTRPDNSMMQRRFAAMSQIPQQRENIPTFSSYVNDVKVKQEAIEPLVEIHETPPPITASVPRSIGSVSITPLPGRNSQKPTLDPSIMKLVQNNPNLTIKTLSENLNRSGSMASSVPPNHKQTNMVNRNFIASGLPVMMESPDLNKCYRCSSCSKPFANKSNLYFHKKNQCSGSKYPCPFCKKRFGTEAAYSSHIFYNHPE